MKSGIAGIIILLDCLAAWLISGSPLPMALSLLLVLIRLTGNRLLSENSFLPRFCIVALLACLQWYLFRTGRAFSVFAELPGIFHLGILFHWWFWWDSVSTSGQKEASPGSVSFWIGAIGSALIFRSVGSVEIYEYPQWRIQLIVLLPLVLIFWTEFIHHRTPGWKSILAIPVSLFILIQASAISQMVADHFYTFLQRDIGETTVADYQESSFTRTGGEASDASSRELPMDADISFDHRIRFLMQADDEGSFLQWIQKPVYVRTSTVAVFRGDRTIAPLRKGEWLYDSDDGVADLFTSVSEKSGGKPFSYSILIPRSDTARLPVLTSTQKLGIPSIYEYSEDWYQLSLAAGPEWFRVRAVADLDYPLFPETNSSWVTHSIFPAPPESPYLSLPDTALSEKIADLTQHLIGGLPPEDFARRIANFVQSHCRYSLHYQNPDHLSPVENFLFGERKGHCELFAAATVLMLRSAGIPSRIAYGYVGGQSDRKGRLLAFRDDDFHSWPEILLGDGESWAVFDTTPSVPQSARHRPSGGDFSRIDLDRYSDIRQFAPVLATQSTGSLFSLNGMLNWMSTHFSGLFIALAALGASIWLLRFAKSSGNGNKSHFHLPKFPVRGNRLAIHLTFGDAISDLGKSCGLCRTRGQTLGEFASVLRSNGIGNSDFFAAIDYLYGIRYAEKARNPALEKQYLKNIRKLIAAVA